jgi:hypothetical protein
MVKASFIFCFRPGIILIQFRARWGQYFEFILPGQLPGPARIEDLHLGGWRAGPWHGSGRPKNQPYKCQTQSSRAVRRATFRASQWLIWMGSSGFVIREAQCRVCALMTQAERGSLGKTPSRCNSARVSFRRIRNRLPGVQGFAGGSFSQARLWSSCCWYIVGRIFSLITALRSFQQRYSFTPCCGVVFSHFAGF